MRSIALALLIVQVSTFIGLGFYFLTNGEPRLGIAQFLLAAVQFVIYSGGIK